jgi:hypothetical protein
MRQCDVGILSPSEQRNFTKIETRFCTGYIVAEGQTEDANDDDDDDDDDNDSDGDRCENVATWQCIAAKQSLMELFGRTESLMYSLSRVNGNYRTE